MLGDFYACEFSVSETANTGDTVNFNLNLNAEGFEN